MPGEHTEILGYKEFEKIKILVASLRNLLLVIKFIINNKSKMIKKIADTRDKANKIL